MTAHTTNGSAKKIFARNNIALAVIAAVLAGVAVFQFAFAQTHESDDNADSDMSAQTHVVQGIFGALAEESGDEPAPQTQPTASGNARFAGMRMLHFDAADEQFIILITMRFILNVIFSYILICVIFAKEYRLKELSFTYFISNILIFMVTSLLASVRVRQGFAFGLFAILSILRFRTEQLKVREMTFFFAALIVGVINSLATDGLSIFTIIWANIILCLSAFLCDKIFMGATNQIDLVYDNTKLLALDKKKELFADIKNRFGYDVVNVVITKMNYLTDSAEVKLVYKRKRERLTH